ncbi:MAG: GNAT family N-acetyltransferase, partial [Elioraea tepidiphila]
MTVRDSTEVDIAAIAAIYRHHVLTGLASFEEVPPEASEMARRRQGVVEAGMPWLVATDADGAGDRAEGLPGSATVWSIRTQIDRHPVGRRGFRHAISAMT